MRVGGEIGARLVLDGAGFGGRLLRGFEAAASSSILYSTCALFKIIKMHVDIHHDTALGLLGQRYLSHAHFLFPQNHHRTAHGAAEISQRAQLSASN